MSSASDDGVLTSTVSLPITGEKSARDYVTIRSTNAGVHHAFSTAGNYYYANSLVPSYTSLPTLTTLQIGGTASASFNSGAYFTNNYHYVTVSLPLGYYLVQGYLDVTPTINQQYIDFGLSFENTSINTNWSQYHKFQSTDRVYLQFNHYVNHENNVNYNFIFYSNAALGMTKSKCTFIRIA